MLVKYINAISHNGRFSFVKNLNWQHNLLCLPGLISECEQTSGRQHSSKSVGTTLVVALLHSKMKKPYV